MASRITTSRFEVEQADEPMAVSLSPSGRWNCLGGVMKLEKHKSGTL